MQDNLRVRATAQIAGHPIHPMLVPIPIACFIGALLTDIAYVVSAEIMWADFSAWLLVVGVIFGVLAAHRRPDRFSRQPPGAGAAAGLAASDRQRAGAGPRAIVNALIHTRDAWTSVWPTGLILSAITVLILPVTGWLGWAMVYRHGVGVAR